MRGRGLREMELLTYARRAGHLKTRVANEGQNSMQRGVTHRCGKKSERHAMRLTRDYETPASPTKWKFTCGV